MRVSSEHTGLLNLCMVVFGILVLGGCARLPYTKTVVHEDQRVAVKLQAEVSSAGYSHPVEIPPPYIAAILRGLSLREQQRLPLRWFAEEVPPRRVFREDEVEVLAPQLAAALQQVGPEERVYFEVFAPGVNPRYRRDVTGGWLAVREHYLHIRMDYCHTQQPAEKSDAYDYNYPTT